MRIIESTSNKPATGTTGSSLNSQSLKNSFLKDHIVEVAFLVIYALMLAFGALSHEMWRDEAQAWLIAKNCNLFELLSLLKSEGHMLPWYLILMPFAKLGAPYQIIEVISCLLVFAAGVLLVFKAPFGRMPNCLILLTYPMLYSMPIISRCYSLIPLAAVLICITHKDRHSKPLPYLLSLVFMANTHLIMWGLVFILALEFFAEFIAEVLHAKGVSSNSKRDLIAMLIALCLIGLTVILPLWGGWSANTDVASSSSFVPTSSFLSDAHDNLSDYVMSLLRFVPVVIIFQIIVLITFVLGFIASPRYTGVFTFCTLYQIYVHNAIRPMDSQKSSALIICLIVACWIYKSETLNKPIQKPLMVKANAALSLVILLPLLFAIYNSLVLYMQDIRMNFSSSKECAFVIETSLPKDAVILSPNRPEYVAPVLAYLGDTDVKFMNVNNGHEITYAVYDECFLSYATPDEIVDYANSFPDGTNLYVLTMGTDFGRESAVALESEGYLTEMFTMEGSDMEEDYFLYRVNR